MGTAFILLERILNCRNDFFDGHNLTKQISIIWPVAVTVHLPFIKYTSFFIDAELSQCTSIVISKHCKPLKITQLLNDIRSVYVDNVDFYLWYISFRQFEYLLFKACALNFLLIILLYCTFLRVPIQSILRIS